MIFCFPVENFLQIGAILNKLECLKIARPAPNLLKGIQLRDRKSGRRTSFYSGRELPLISDEKSYQTTVGAGDLYCLKNTNPPAGARAAYEIAIIPGPNTLVMRYPRITSPTFNFFATTALFP